MMLLQLVKKDVLIVKRYVLTTLLVIVAIPLFVMLAAPSLSGLYPFLYMVVLGELILLQAISQEEEKYPKAAALLCASPYSRNTFVVARYVLFLLIFAYCCIVHTLVMLVANKSNILDLTTLLTVMLAGVIVFGVYTPIEFKHGFAKAKLIFVMVIVLFSLGPTLLGRLLAGVTIDFSALSPAVKNTALALLAIVILGGSLAASLRIFSKKEL